MTDNRLMCDFTPHFYCDLYSNNGFHKQLLDTNRSSYLKTNNLKWLLEKDKDHNYCNYWNDEEMISLFDTNFEISFNSLTTKQITIAFTFTKKFFNELRSASMSRSDSHRYDYNYDFCVLRDKICKFLTFVKRYLYKICIISKAKSDTIDISHQMTTSCIMKEMKSLLLFIGRISQLNSRVVDLGVRPDSQTAIYNYFHVYLDIWWTSIEMTYIVNQNNGINLNDFNLVKEEMCNSLCSQAIKLVLYDLIGLSVEPFNEIIIVHQYLSLSPFKCSCIKEMFIMIKHIVNALNSDISSNNNNFLQHIFLTLDLFTNSDSTNSKSISEFKAIQSMNYKMRSSLHFLWFTTSIAEVFAYDLTGNFSEQLNAGVMPSAVFKAITKQLKENEVTINESELSCIILFCIKMSHYFKPNSDLLLPLTEFFLKKLNYRFVVQNSIEDLAIVPKSSYKWKQMIASISALDEHNFRKESSFKLYLSLVSQQLLRIFKYCDQKNKANNWQKFKGKVIVNLQPKKLEKINETGIFNLLCFYLILINTNEEIWNEMIDKNFNIIVELSKQNNSKHLELILRFTFTTLNIKPNSISDTKVISFIANQFNKLCEESLLNSGSKLSDGNFSNIMNLYFEELKLIVESDQFSNMPFDKLLNIKFCAFSSVQISLNDKLFVFNFINVLLKRINRIIESSYDKSEPNIPVFINSCLENILPFVKKEISSKDYNENLVNIAFHFTTLTNSMNELNLNQSEKFLHLFNDILKLSQKNPRFTCRYLSKILENQKLIESLKKVSPLINSNLISIWCRLLVNQEISETQMNTLSGNMCLLIDDLRFGETLEFSTTSLDIFISFLNNLTQMFSISQQRDQLQLIQESDKYFREMVLTAQSIFNENDVSTSIFSKIFEYISNLVLIASPLLYVPNDSKCLLPTIIEFIIESKHLKKFQRKPDLKSTFQRAYPRFFEGLRKLLIKDQQNKYLNRKINRIFELYWFVLVDGLISFHEIKKSFEEQETYYHWREVLSENISKKLLIEKITPSFLSFLCNLCKFDLTHRELIIVLNYVLNEALRVDNNLKNSLYSLIKIIIEKIVNTSQHQNHKTLVDEVFTSFIETNLCDHSVLGKLFQILRWISDLCPNIFHDLIGEITRSIESIEKKRSFGQNKILRDHLKNFANKR